MCIPCYDSAEKVAFRDLEDNRGISHHSISRCVLPRFILLYKIPCLALVMTILTFRPYRYLTVRLLQLTSRLVAQGRSRCARLDFLFEKRDKHRIDLLRLRCTIPISDYRIHDSHGGNSCKL